MDSTESVSHTPPQSQRRLRPRVGGAAAISKTSSSSNILESRQWAEQGPILDPPHTSSAETQNHLPATDDELDISSGSFLQLMQASSPFPVQNGGKTQPDVTASRADLLSSVVPTETRQQASQEGKESVTAQDPENENVGLKHARTSARKVRSVQTYPIPAPKLQLRQGRQNQSLDRLRMRALQGKASTAPSPSQQQPLSLQGKNDNPGFLGPTPSPAPSVVSSRGLKAKQPPLSSPAAALMSMQLAAMSRANVATMKSSSGVGSPTTSPTLPIAGTPVHASPWLTPYGSPYLSGPSRSSLLSSMLANSYYQQPPGSPFYPPSSLSPHPFSNPYLTASTYNHLMSMVPMPMTSPLKAKRASKGSSTYHGSPAISRRPTVGIGMARPQGETEDDSSPTLTNHSSPNTATIVSGSQTSQTSSGASSPSHVVSSSSLIKALLDAASGPGSPSQHVGQELEECEPKATELLGSQGGKEMKVDKDEEQGGGSFLRDENVQSRDNEIGGNRVPQSDSSYSTRVDCDGGVLTSSGVNDASIVTRKSLCDQGSVRLSASLGSLVSSDSTGGRTDARRLRGQRAIDQQHEENQMAEQQREDREMQELIEESNTRQDFHELLSGFKEDVTSSRIEENAMDLLHQSALSLPSLLSSISSSAMESGAMADDETTTKPSQFFANETGAISTSASDNVLAGLGIPIEGSVHGSLSTSPTSSFAQQMEASLQAGAGGEGGFSPTFLSDFPGSHTFWDPASLDVAPRPAYAQTSALQNAQLANAMMLETAAANASVDFLSHTRYLSHDNPEAAHPLHNEGASLLRKKSQEQTQERNRVAQEVQRQGIRRRSMLRHSGFPKPSQTQGHGTSQHSDASLEQRGRLRSLHASFVPSPLASPTFPDRGPEPVHDVKDADKAREEKEQRKSAMDCDDERRDPHGRSSDRQEEEEEPFQEHDNEHQDGDEHFEDSGQDDDIDGGSTQYIHPFQGFAAKRPGRIVHIDNVTGRAVAAPPAFDSSWMAGLQGFGGGSPASGRARQSQYPMSGYPGVDSYYAAAAMMMMPMHMPMPWGYGPPNSSPGVGGYGGIGHKVPPEIGPPYFPPSPHPAYSAWLAAMAAGNSEAAATAAAFYGSPEGMGVGVDGAGPPGFFPPHFGYVGSWNHVGGGMSERAMADREMDERAMRNMKVGMERQGGTVNSDGSEEGEGDEKDVEDLLDPTESPERADFQEHTPAGGLGMLWGPPDLRRLETAKKAGLSVLTRMNGGVGENREVPLSPAVASPHVEQPEDNHVAMLEGLQAADDGRVENSGGDEVDSSGKGQRRDSGMEQPRSPRRSSRLEQEVPPSGPIRVGSRLRPASRNVHSFYASGGVFKQPPPVVSASPASQPLRRTRSTTDAVPLSEILEESQSASQPSAAVVSTRKRTHRASPLVPTADRERHAAVSMLRRGSSVSVASAGGVSDVMEAGEDMMNANALSTALSCHPSTRAGSSTPSAPNSPVIGSGEKVERKNTFVCTFPDCDKSFSKAYSLKTHHISHSNQRPFCCLFCTGKSFARKHDLLRHVRTVHGSKLPQLPQECIYCQAKMNQMEELTEHLYNCAVGPICKTGPRSPAQLRPIRNRPVGSPPFPLDYEGGDDDMVDEMKAPVVDFESLLTQFPSTAASAQEHLSPSQRQGVQPGYPSVAMLEAAMTGYFGEAQKGRGAEGPCPLGPGFSLPPSPLSLGEDAK